MYLYPIQNVSSIKIYLAQEVYQTFYPCGKFLLCCVYTEVKDRQSRRSHKANTSQCLAALSSAGWVVEVGGILWWSFALCLYGSASQSKVKQITSVAIEYWCVWRGLGPLLLPLSWHAVLNYRLWDICRTCATIPSWFCRHGIRSMIRLWHSWNSRTAAWLTSSTQPNCQPSSKCCCTGLCSTHSHFGCSYAYSSDQPNQMAKYFKMQWNPHLMQIDVRFFPSFNIKCHQSKVNNLSVKFPTFKIFLS
jgi:hypothetical protein